MLSLSLFISLAPPLQEKLIAEDKARDMEAELDRLRKEVATAEQTAAKDQGMLIRAAEERMAVLDKVNTTAVRSVGCLLLYSLYGMLSFRNALGCRPRGHLPTCRSTTGLRVWSQ